MQQAKTFSRREFLKRQMIFLAAACLPGTCLSGCSLLPRTTEPPPDQWYSTYKDKIIEEVKQTFDYTRQILINHYGKADAQTLYDSTLNQFSELLPDLPYIGGYANSLTSNLYMGAASLAFYQVMKPYGVPIEKIGEIIYQSVEKQFLADPLSGMDGRLSTSQTILDKFKEAAQNSQRRTYPGDWVFEFVPGDGISFDYGIDYLECGICKYFKSQGAEEFTPYLCLLDFPVSEVMNTGLVRTTTLARGGERCDFRYKMDRPIQPEWNPGFISKGK